MFACLLSAVAGAAPGQLDLTFGGGNGYVATLIGSGSARGAKVALYPDGKIVVAGSCNNGSVRKFCVARYHFDGSVDAGFGQSGMSSASFGNLDDVIAAVTVQANGMIVTAGYCAHNDLSGRYSFCIARFDASGVLDLTFGAGGKALTSLDLVNHGLALAIQTDGKLVVAGNCGDGQSQRFCMARYLQTGALDTAFGVNGKVITSAVAAEYGSSLLIQSDQKLVVLGHCASQLGRDFCAARYLPSGLLDDSFGTSGKVVIAMGRPETLVIDSALQPDGKIILYGACGAVGGNDIAYCLARIDSDGLADVTFGVQGRVLSNVSREIGRGMVLQPDGKIVLAVDECGRFCLLRYTESGVIDPTFDGGRVYTQILQDADTFDVALQPDGNIVASGVCSNQQGEIFFCLARYQGGPYPAQACGLNADANNTIAPGTDALLLSRYLLGFRGNALTNGALGQNPTRTGQALEIYLASLNLDADGDGQALATTDGLLILRAMLGLTGDALTQGATNTAHPNVRNAQQVLSWIESTHGFACLP